jgi:hypothetical protein
MAEVAKVGIGEARVVSRRQYVARQRPFCFRFGTHPLQKNPLYPLRLQLLGGGGGSKNGKLDTDINVPALQLHGYFLYRIGKALDQHHPHRSSMSPGAMLSTLAD